MQRFSQIIIIGEKSCLTTLLKAAKETTNLLRAGPIWPLFTIIFVIYTCLLIPEKCALFFFNRLIV